MEFKHFCLLQKHFVFGMKYWAEVQDVSDARGMNDADFILVRPMNLSSKLEFGHLWNYLGWIYIYIK